MSLSTTDNSKLNTFFSPLIFLVISELSSTLEVSTTFEPSLSNSLSIVENGKLIIVFPPLILNDPLPSLTVFISVISAVNAFESLVSISILLTLSLLGNLDTSTNLFPVSSVPLSTTTGVLLSSPLSVSESEPPPLLPGVGFCGVSPPCPFPGSIISPLLIVVYIPLGTLYPWSFFSYHHPVTII
ncbi:hypothetical protein D3C76_894030 [compost metagenome]